MKIKKFFPLLCAMLCAVFVFASCTGGKKDAPPEDYNLPLEDGKNPPKRRPRTLV